MAKKKTVITLSVIGGIIVVLAIGIAVALNMVNRQIETEISSKLDANIEASGIGEYISYSDVKSEAGRGRITLSGVSFITPEGDVQVQVEAISVKVPPFEAAAMARDPENTTLSKAELITEKVAFSDSETGSRSKIGELSVRLEGELGQNLMQAGPAVLLQKITSADVQIHDSAFVPGEKLLAQLQMMGMDKGALFSEEGEMEIKTLAIDSELSPENLNLRSMELDSGMVKMTGWMDMKINEMQQPEEVKAHYSVDRLEDNLRTTLAQIFQQLGQPLPESGGFEVDFNLPKEGNPQISVE